MSETQRDVYLHATPSDNPALGPIAQASFTRVLVNANGVLWNAVADPNGNPITSDAITADAIVPSGAPGGTLSLNVAANLRAVNAAGNLDRVRTLVSNADAQVAAQLGLLGAVARPQWFNGVTFDRARSLASNTDAQVAAQLGLAGAVMRPYIFNGASFDRQRAPVSFASVSATAAGITAIVAAVGGQGIRLLRYIVEITVNAAAAAAAIEVVTLNLNAISTGLVHSFHVPAVAVVTGVGNFTTGWIDLGPIGAAAAAGALDVNLGTALTAGAVRVTVAYIQGATT